MEDNLLRMRPKSPADRLRELTEKPQEKTLPAEPEAAETPPSEEPDRFDPDSSSYKAFGRASNKTLPSLRFILKDKSERGVSYAHLDSLCPDGCEFIPSMPGKGNVVKLRFAGAATPFMVVMEGRYLRRLWELVMGHLTPWVHEYPADMHTEGENVPVVTSITFNAVK